MARRRDRFEMPRDPAQVVRSLRACRDAMNRVHIETVPFGPTYRLASGVVMAIDAFADHLTKKDRYFSIGGSVASEANLQETRNWIAREKGELPWPR